MLDANDNHSQLSQAVTNMIQLCIRMMYMDTYADNDNVW